MTRDEFHPDQVKKIQGLAKAIPDVNPLTNGPTSARVLLETVKTLDVLPELVTTGLPVTFDIVAELSESMNAWVASQMQHMTFAKKVVFMELVAEFLATKGH